MRMPEKVYSKTPDLVFFNQLAVKVEMDTVSNSEYFAWLDSMTAKIGQIVPGAQIVEKDTARISPPLNIAVYYDTPDYQILPTGALLRTSCNRITHAFCAFKMAEDEHNVRNDHRYVFCDDEKRIIQQAPTSPEAVGVVMQLLARKDISHPGTYLEKHYGIRAESVQPAIVLDDYRFTFFVWIDKKDALRCSIDRYLVSDLRTPEYRRAKLPLSEVEIAIYPRIDPDVARDQRVVELIHVLTKSLCDEFGVAITRDIKYQRAARALNVSC